MVSITTIGENRLAADQLNTAILSQFGIKASHYSSIEHVHFENIAREDTTLVIEYLAAKDFPRQNIPHEFKAAVYCAPNSRDEAVRLLQMGYDGYFPVTMSGSAITCALELVIRGERYVPAVAIGGCDTPPPPEDELSPKQLKVLEMMARGASNKSIARSLKVEEVTIKSHVRAIFRKLKVRSRTEAARYAIMGHLV